MPRRLATIINPGRSLIRVLALTLLLATFSSVVDGTFVRAQETDDPADQPIPEEGRLYNLTTQPFRFQLHRADGAAWTETITIPAGKFYAVKVPKKGESTEVQGITGNGKGFVIIRYPESILGGYMTLRLPAQNPANQKIQPTWFAVKDSNGITRLVQEPSVEAAKTVQEGLKKQPPMTPQELERSKHMLRANWVLTN